MKTQVLNVTLVRARIEAKGLKLNWVLSELNLRYTFGHQMFQHGHGRLPADAKVRTKALKRLSEILEIPESQLTVTPNN